MNQRFRMMAAPVAALVVLTLAVAAIPAQAQTPIVIYSFPGGSEPANPYAEAIAQGRDGNLYSTTVYGGVVGTTTGTVFKITPAGTVTVVYAEPAGSGPLDDCYPYSGVTLGTDGNFYGTNYYGGANGHGEVYKVTAAGVVTPLHSFAGTGDGANPYSAPIEGTNGVFYGTTTSATVNSTVYSVTSGGTFNTLHTFTGTDGQNVDAPLVQGTDGNFYGNTAAGGTGNGVIFKMAPSGKVTVLHTFAGTDGSNASYPLIQASDGNFYGTTYLGGSSNAGVIFKITAGGTYNVIYNLNGTTDGSGPSSALVQATNGKLYGVAANVSDSTNDGTIFSVTTSGTFTALYAFTGYGSPEGGYPVSPLIQHTDGLLYGTTYVGGSPGNDCNSILYPGGEPTVYNGCGVFYKLNVGLGPFVSLLPRSGKEGAVIGILGQGFTSASVVKFDGVTAVSTTHGSNFIKATVPAGTLTGLATVTTGATTLTSNKAFRVTPTFPSFNPTSGPVTTPVVLTGTGLTQTTKVTFGGVKATIVTVNSDTQVTADVPTGAVTGKIVITTKGGHVANSTDFTVN
jgi:uncharacterized repeat protein (TIGR03803 family)